MAFENPSRERAKQQTFSVSESFGEDLQGNDGARKTYEQAVVESEIALLGIGELNDFRDQCRHFLEGLVGCREFFRQFDDPLVAVDEL